MEFWFWTIGTLRLSTFPPKAHSGSARFRSSFVITVFYIKIGQLYSRGFYYYLGNCNSNFPLFFCHFSRYCQFGRSFLHFLFSVVARKLSITGSIRIFEKKNSIPKPPIFVFLKVKLPDMTDWHILPGLKIDVLIACCRLFAADLSLSTPQNSQPCKIFTLSLNSNQNLHTPAPVDFRFLS